MKKILVALFLMSLHSFSFAEPDILSAAQGCAERSEKSNSVTPRMHLCHGGRVLALESRRNKIHLVSKSGRSLLETIPNNYNPASVGGAALIGFLPIELQPYADKDVFLYISSKRTRSGNGGGQCGAGIEMYLNVLAVNPKATLLSSHLIGSCAESIEIADQNLAASELGQISVESGNLTIEFLHFKGRDGSPKARLSDDLRGLIIE